MRMMGIEAPERGQASATATERMQRVLQLLESREAISVIELAQVFSVSEVTVRSDLASLARQGLVARIRGQLRTGANVDTGPRLRQGVVARAATTCRTRPGAASA